MIQRQGPSYAIFQSALYQTTSTVVQTDDLVLVVDPNCLPHEVDDIGAYVRSIRGKRPLYIVFTHSDWDHVLGFGAFTEGIAIASKAASELSEPEAILKQIRDFDDSHYVIRPYPITYPRTDIVVDQDNFEVTVGGTTLRFWLAPGHTPDGLFLLVEPAGIFIAGDYLSDVEFPFVTDSSVRYEQTLEKAIRILDGGAVTLTVPGHGQATDSTDEAKARCFTGLTYLRTLRDAVANGQEAETASLIESYRFAGGIRSFHEDNLRLMRKELGLASKS